MQTQELSNEELLQELESINSKIAQLRKQRSGLDNEIDHYYLRKNEITDEIIKRFKEDV
jgi:uncharacterized protein YlxW (UPF0749 family)